MSSDMLGCRGGQGQGVCLDVAKQLAMGREALSLMPSGPRWPQAETRLPGGTVFLSPWSPKAGREGPAGYQVSSPSDRFASSLAGWASLSCCTPESSWLGCSCLAGGSSRQHHLDARGMCSRRPKLECLPTPCSVICQFLHLFNGHTEMVLSGLTD